MTTEERDALVHVAADWDARAAQLERGSPPPGRPGAREAKVLRECAARLKTCLAELAGLLP